MEFFASSIIFLYDAFISSFWVTSSNSSSIFSSLIDCPVTCSIVVLFSSINVFRSSSILISSISSVVKSFIILSVYLFIKLSIVSFVRRLSSNSFIFSSVISGNSFLRDSLICFITSSFP